LHSGGALAPPILHRVHVMGVIRKVHTRAYTRTGTCTPRE